MRRFFVDRVIHIGDAIELCGEEARHILTVLRMGVGDRIIIINGGGTELTSEISAVDRAEGILTLNIIDEAPCIAEPSVEITLYQCLPKAGKMDLIIQKCVELGIHRIVPVQSKRCVVKVEAFGGKLVRYNRISHEAAKQCGRGTVPEVCDAIALRDCDFSPYDLVLVAYEAEELNTLKTVLSNNHDALRLAIVIGPEGGFEPDEVNYIVSASNNAHSVSLGKRILRTETAGMAMLAMLMYELEG